MQLPLLTIGVNSHVVLLHENMIIKIIALFTTTLIFSMIIIC